MSEDRAATVGNAITSSNAVGSLEPPRGSAAGYDALVRAGSLGLRVGGAAFCGSVYTCGSEAADGSITAFLTDTFTITGATDGFVALDVLYEGTLSYSGIADRVSSELSVTGGGGEVFRVSQQVYEPTVLHPELTRAVYVNGSSTTTAVPYSAPSSFSLLTTLYLPFSDGTAGLAVSLFGAFSCSSGLDQSCSVESDFRNTAVFGGAHVVDSNKQFVSGATLVSASEYDYSRSIAPVPDGASTLQLLGIGITAGVALRRATRT